VFVKCKISVSSSIAIDCLKIARVYLIVLFEIFISHKATVVWIKGKCLPLLSRTKKEMFAVTC
jgi:hypothetical protein